MSTHSAGPIVVIGNGLIGSAIAGRLRAAGRSVVTVARRDVPGGAHLTRDLADRDDCERLRADLRELRPYRIVATHGPSDVTWIESHETAAAAVHAGVAGLLAGTGVPTVLVSTDNVFDGTRGLRRAAEAVAPQNAYGRVKLRAERLLLATGRSLALRVSLVYGWVPAGYRATYAQRCIETARRGEPLDAPADQIFTPIHLDDVAIVIASLCQSDGMPTGVAHLSGPGELSRYAFARTAYSLAGADEALVRRCLRRDTEWASRPRFSSLCCDDFGHLPGLSGWWPATAEAGLARMCRTAPEETVPR